MVDSINFDSYLRSLTHHYTEWWSLYAFMDEINDSTWFEFELTSKTQEKPTEPGGKPEEKTQLVLQAIDDYAHEKILIVGSPGAGKSTLLARVLWQAAKKARQDKNALIPVLLELKLYPELEIWERIQRALENSDLYLESPEIKQLIQDKRLLLLADGFNELPTDSARAEFKKFCGRNIPVIVTSRDAADGLGLSRKLELQPPSSQQVAQFLEERLPDSDRAQVQKLGDRVKDLGQTPLMIWMLYSIFRAKHEIPETRGETYRAFTTLYAESAKDGIDLTESRFIMSKLAFEMMQSPKPTDPTDSQPDISEVDAQTFLGSEKTLKHLINNHLLQWQGKPGNRKVRFCHQSLQEYYAAEFLLSEKLLKELKEPSERNNKIRQQEYLNYLKWTEAIALMLGLADEGLAIRVVELAIGVDLMLGARLAGEVKQGVQEKTVRNVLDLKVPQLLKFQLLGATHSSVAVPELMNVLQVEEDIYQKYDAAFALRVLGSKAAVSALMNALTHENEITIATAAFALGALGDYSAIPSLLDMLNHSNHHVMRNAVSSLGELRAKDAVSKLIEKLGNEPYVIKDTIDALGEIGDEDAIPELIKTVLNSNHLLSGYASKALKKINSEKASKDLLGFLKENNYRIAGKAAEALGEIGCESAVKALFNALNDGYVGWASAEALKKIGGSKAISALLEALQSRNPSACGWAIHALGELGDPIAVEGLIGVLAYWDCSVVEEAVEALGKIGDKTAIPPLLRFLQDEEYKTRRPEIYQKAVIALGKLGSNSAKPELLRILEDQSPSIQPWLWAQICDALENLGSEDVVTGLLSILKSANHSYLRLLSAQALGNLGNKTASEGLLNALKDEDSSVRFHAAKALGKLPSQKVIPRLLRLLEDENPKIREAAIKALGALRAEESVSKLLEILEKEECDIRYDAIEALKEIGSIIALDKLQELQKIMDDNFVYAIASIQSRCQFYNYELEEERKAIATQTDEEERTLEQSIPQTRTILILAASPTDQARLRLGQEVRDIDESLCRSKHRDRFDIKQKWAVRPSDLRRALLDHTPQILHFCGHGEGEQGIVLENTTGKSQLVSTEAIADLFKLFADRGLECVVLNACYAEVQAKAIVQHIPYVIGMSAAILDTTALKFAVGFYDALGAGWSYAEAFEMGKNAIAIEGIPEADLPVLKQK